MPPIPGDSRSSNVRRLEPLDILRCVTLGAGEMTNLSLALSEVGRSQSFRLTMLALSRRHLWPRSEDSVWVWAAGGRPLGIASVRPRSGVASWELPHLFADADHGGPISDLMEAATRASATKGAERVFLRVPAESDTVPVARRAGFFPGCRETLYSGRPYHSRVGGGLFDADSKLRPRRDEDDHDLFRMYNSATPVRVRQLAGMTLEQWRASRERHPGRRAERVLEIDGSVCGLLETSLSFGTGTLALSVHPDYAALTPDVVDAGLKTLSRARNVFVVAPEYNPAMGRALEERGFRAAGDFAMLVNSTAQMVRERVPSRSSLAAAE